MKRCFLLLLSAGLILSNVFAQSIQKMDLWQDSLVHLGQRMFSSIAEAERLESNFKFVKTLVSALKESNAYFYEFDRLGMISILDSPDDNFRIFSWNIPLQDGSYLYYGAIQHKVLGGKLKLTPLLDKTFEIQHPHTDITSAQMWYGAQYYDIVPLSKGQYILLGWKGHHVEYSQKIIEVLNIGTAGEVTLGAHLFSDDATLSRKVFSYKKSVTMFLRFNPTLNRVEFDHIVPIRSEFAGDFKHYGPDLTHDSYEIKNMSLFYKEDIELSNPEHGNESKYIDPLRPDRKLKSGF